MRAIMISIKPEWVEKILNGEKTIEIRKTMPKCELPCKVYIYETKGKGKFVNCGKKREKIGGKVVAEFTLNIVNEFKVFENSSVQYWNWYNLEKSCLTYDEISNYIGRDKIGYAWHINNLKIYDKPKELSEFKKADCQQIINKLEYMGCDELYCNSQVNTTMCLDDAECDYNCCPKLKITRPPQSWCYVEEIENVENKR